jgi:hypothetical protein
MQLAANVTSGDLVDWHSIDWKQVYGTVKNLRQRIFRASREGDLKRARSLQRLMLRCRANGLESVRRVTRVNQGRKKEVGFAISSANSIFTVSTRSVGFISPSVKAKGRSAFRWVMHTASPY